MTEFTKQKLQKWAEIVTGVVSVENIADLAKYTLSLLERLETAETAVAFWPRRAANLLSVVESPSSSPEGEPGSLHRRAWEIGRRHKETRTSLDQAEERSVEHRLRAEKAEAELAKHPPIEGLQQVWRPVAPAPSDEECARRFGEKHIKPYVNDDTNALRIKEALTKAFCDHRVAAIASADEDHQITLRQLYDEIDALKKNGAEILTSTANILQRSHAGIWNAALLHLMEIVRLNYPTDTVSAMGGTIARAMKSTSEVSPLDEMDEKEEEKDTDG